MEDKNSVAGYTFKNPALLEKALTHSSYANEARLRHTGCNERPEFLGDAILGFICAEYLYHKLPETPEGELTKLRAAIVCEKSLCIVAKEWKIDTMLRLGKGEETGGGRERPSILADAVEAVLAAVYLDGGMDAARDLAMTFIPHGLELAMDRRYLRDYKTTLQEIVQKGKQETLSYKITGESGPDHNKRFFVQLYLNSNMISEGEGKSKKEAEQAAAKAALMLMGEL